MNRTHPIYLGIILALILSACSAATPAPSMEAIPTETLTPFVLPPEFTPTMTETPEPTQAAPAESEETPVVAEPADPSDPPAVEEPSDAQPAVTSEKTATASSPVISSGPICNNALYIQDVTIPDGTVVAPGKKFVKTWRIKNFGACRWSATYAIGFAYGSPLGGVETKLPVAVEPGQTVDVSVVLTAPTDNGWYGSWWRMKTDTGVNFGDFVFASIQVTEGKAIPTPTSTPTP